MNHKVGGPSMSMSRVLLGSEKALINTSKTSCTFKHQMIAPDLLEINQIPCVDIFIFNYFYVFECTFFKIFV